MAKRGVAKPPRFPHHLEQPLLALHTEEEMRGYLQAAVNLLSAAVPHDTTYVLLHYFDGIAFQSLTYDTRGRGVGGGSLDALRLCGSLEMAKQA